MRRIAGYLTNNSGETDRKQRQKKLIYSQSEMNCEKIICHAERSEASRMRPRGCTRDPSRSFRMTIQDDNTSRIFRKPILFYYKITLLENLKQASNPQKQKRNTLYCNYQYLSIPLRDSGAIRTLDPRLRRALLYPAELRNPFSQLRVQK